jgi:hypothetical protein
LVALSELVELSAAAKAGRQLRALPPERDSAKHLRRVPRNVAGEGPNTERAERQLASCRALSGALRFISAWLGTTASPSSPSSPGSSGSSGGTEVRVRVDVDRSQFSTGTSSRGDSSIFTASGLGRFTPRRMRSRQRTIQKA